MGDVGLNIKVSADVKDAIDGVGRLSTNINQLESQLSGAEKELNNIGRAIDQAIAKGQDFSKLEDAFQAASDKVKALKTQIASLPQAIAQTAAPAAQAANAIGGSFNQLSFNTRTARLGFVDLFRVINGGTFSPRTLAANFALLGPAGLVAGAALVGLVEILSHQTDAEKKAAEQAKELQKTLENLKSATDVNIQATGSAQGDIQRVRDLAAAVQDTNLSYKERERALQELKTTNKSYFGDLDLETKSLTTLSERVREYANALVTEAIIKDQTSEIAKMSEEYLKQEKILQTLKTARDQANVEAAKPQPNTPGSVASGGPDVLNNDALATAAKAQAAFEKQRDAVEKLSGAIAEYNGELNTNIGIQIKQRPLQIVQDKQPQELETLLTKIREVKAELAKPQEGALFKLNQQSQDQDIGVQFKEKIALAIQEGAKIGTTQAGQYATELANLYRQQLTRIQNPDLHARIQGTVAVTPTELDKITSEVEKQFGTKEIKVKVPLGLEESLKDQGFNKQEIQDLMKKSAEDADKGIPTIPWTPEIALAINEAELTDQFKDQLTESINKAISSSATSGLDNIGKSIGAAIAKGQNPVQAAGEAILGTIGSLVEQMGQALVKYGVETLIVQDILKSGLEISPGVAIAAGVAMIAAGEVLKKSIKVPAFAAGGIVTGPTYGLIGEAGPEAIFPLSKISDFMANLPGKTDDSGGGGGQAVIRGQDLVLIMNRAQKNLNFVGKQA